MLPKNELPTYTTKIPSLQKTVIYRPMKVKEQRNLMTATDSDSTEIYRVMKLCVKECTFNEVDVDNLPNFDVEYLFTQIRIMSIGEIIKVDVTCPDCGFIETKSMNLNDTRIEKLDTKKSSVKLSENLVLDMRYPTIQEIGMIEDSPDSETVFSVVRNCVLRIFSGSEIHEKADISDEELKFWLEDCTNEQFSKLEEFIVDSPYLVSDITNTCEKCKTVTKFSLKGIKSFFV